MPLLQLVDSMVEIRMLVSIFGIFVLHKGTKYRNGEQTQL
jgi:hypothetical protein